MRFNYFFEKEADKIIEGRSIKIVMEMVNKRVAMARFLTDNPDILPSFLSF